MPAKQKTPSNATDDNSSKSSRKKPVSADAPEDSTSASPKPNLTEMRKSTLDLLDEKPKQRREENTAPQVTKFGAKKVQPPAAQAAEKPAPPAQPKKEALSLFDEKERRAKKREEAGPPTAPGNKPSILPSISRRIQKKEDQKEADKAALTALFHRPQGIPAEPEQEPGAGGESAPVPTVQIEAEDPEDEDSKIINLKPPIIVKDLAERMGMKGFKLVAELITMDIFVNQNQSIEPDVAAKICEKHGFIFEREKREKGAGIHKEEKVMEPPPPPVEEKVDELLPRPPIVTVMGHVDHGKTSLLDAIRQTRIAAGEAGGITQHIGAYSVERNGQKITFLDTPGHAAFTAMRARGAHLTDIVILVVAADDGLMPQTIECISHAKAAGVTIVVALNKMDLPSANPDRVYAQLQEQGLSPEAWGGTTPVMPVSALKRTGVEELLEHTLLEAELMELRANPKAPCRAIIVESRMEAGKGPSATVIPRTGTLKLGASFICGPFFGKVKNLLSDTGKIVKQAGPATPVEVIGFSDMPNVGDELVVMDDREAKKIAEQRQEDQRKEKLAVPRRATLDSIFKQMAVGGKKELRVLVKTDVQGSLEAIVGQLKEIKSEKIDLVVLHSAVGPISDNDVLLASASDAIILGFAVKVEAKAVRTAKSEGVEIKLYSVIYELFDQVKLAMLGKLDPTTREKILGHAIVKQLFKVQKIHVAGCGVTDGKVIRAGFARVLRGKEKTPVYDGRFHTLKRYTEDVTEVRNGLECGIRLGDFDDYEVNDIIECYELEKLAQTL